MSIKSKLLPWRPALAGLVFFIALYAMYWVVFAMDKDAHVRWFGKPVERGGEDMVMEWIGFSGFLIAGVVTMWALRFKAKMVPVLVYLSVLGAGLFYLVCAGEEISWGQRIFGWETPESYKEINMQDETNLHNLETGWFHPKDVVSWWMKLFGIFLPIGFWWYARKCPDRAWLRRCVSPLSLVPLYVFVEIFNKLEKPLLGWARGQEDRDIWRLIGSQHEEMMEMYWGLCVAFAAIGIYGAWRRA